MADSSNIFNYGASLVSDQNKVQSPFIIVKIGNYTFGNYKKTRGGNDLLATYKVTYPNYMNSITVTKVNGDVNTYKISMTYAITNTDDPNMLDKVFSSVSNSRKITITYGDWELPTYIYKEEEALITKISTKMNLDVARIDYDIECTSTALSLQAGVHSFEALVNTKPSDEIKRILFSLEYGLQDVFKGMINKDVVLNSGMIASDDAAVDIPAKTDITVFDYISFLVSYMVSTSDVGKKVLKKSVYYWYLCDDTHFQYGGNYFKVVKVDSSVTTEKSINTYVIDVGYPSANNVSNFSITQDDEWALLYNYSKDINLPEYSYEINNKGEIEEIYSPMVTTSSKYFITTEASRTWWSMMTQFPLQATLTIQGLLRPSTLMSYVKVNVYFYSHKHVSSGLYIITKQVDTISNKGYKTTLNLLRVGEDTDFNESLGKYN